MLNSLLMPDNCLIWKWKNDKSWVYIVPGMGDGNLKLKPLIFFEMFEFSNRIDNLSQIRRSQKIEVVCISFCLALLV